MNNQQILHLLQSNISRDIVTTIPQMSDSLDFHDVHIKGLVSLIKQAYATGHSAGYKKGITSKTTDKPCN